MRALGQDLKLHPETMMKRKVLTLTLAAQLAAFSAVAQTAGTVGDPAGTDAGTGAMGGVSATPETFGADWSMILGSAMFEMDGRTVRSDDELVGQWGTLSEQDRDIIRRDCMALEQEEDGMDGAAAPGSPGTAGAGTADTAADADTQTPIGAEAGTDAAQADPLDGTTAAGAEPGQEGAEGAGGITGTADGTAQPGSPIMIQLTSEQMEQICDVLEDEL